MEQARLPYCRSGGYPLQSVDHLSPDRYISDSSNPFTPVPSAGALRLPSISAQLADSDCEVAQQLFEQSRVLEEMGKAHCMAVRNRLIGQLYALEAVEQSSRVQRLAGDLLPKISANWMQQGSNSFAVEPCRSRSRASLLQRAGSSLIMDKESRSGRVLPSLQHRGSFAESDAKRRRSSFGDEMERPSQQRELNQNCSERLVKSGNRSQRSSAHPLQKMRAQGVSDTARWNGLNVKQKAIEFELRGRAA